MGSGDLRIFFLVALLALAACDKKAPETPQPKARSAPVPYDRLPNYRKGLVKMGRMAHEPDDIKRARRAMPGLIAKAESLYIKNAASARTCAAWDAVAANAIRQNDAGLVHIWGTLADRRCAAGGGQTRYWVIS